MKPMTGDDDVEVATLVINHPRARAALISRACRRAMDRGRTDQWREKNGNGALRVRWPEDEAPTLVRGESRLLHRRRLGVRDHQATGAWNCRDRADIGLPNLSEGESEIQVQ